MRRLLIAVSLSTLANTGIARAQRTPAPLAPYTGTWHAITYNRTVDSIVVTCRWTLNSDSSGTFTFGDEPPHSGTRVVFASADSIVFDVLSPLRFQAGHPLDSATQRYVARVVGDSIRGTVYTRVKDGRQGRRPFTGARATPAPGGEDAHALRHVRIY